MAKRDLPAGHRIMIERAMDRQEAMRHPGTAELEPSGGALDHKFDLNSMGTGGGESVLCLRMARANHACAPNASHFSLNPFNVKVLLADKPILAGEEICIGYTTFLDFESDSPNLSPGARRQLLQGKWGIVRPADCACRDVQLIEKAKEARSLDASIMDLASSRQFDRALMAVKRLVKLEQELSAALQTQARTQYDGFQVAVCRRSTLPQAMGYIRRAYELAVAVGGTEWRDAVRYKELVERPESHRNCLVA